MADIPLIVHIVYALGTGGLENGLVNIINRMPANKYRHAIICLTVSGEFAARITAPDVEIIELKQRPGHDIYAYWRLWKVLRTLRPAIVHTRNLAAMEMQLVAFFTRGAHRVHGEHGRDIYDLDGSNRKYNILRRLLRPFIQRYICVSRDLYGWLIESVGVARNRVNHIYNGVDQECFSPNRLVGTNKLLNLNLPSEFLNEDTIVVGTVGRLAEVKNQISLISAFKILRDSQTDIYTHLRLMLVGDGPMRQQLESAIQEAGLSEQVLVTGNRSDIPALLNAMDIFVLPSLGEGISNTILEAMASSLPVIATEVGGNPELVDQDINGIVYPVGDNNALANAILRLANNPETRIKMGEAGCKKVRETFNWDRTVKDYIAVYDQILA